MAAATELLPLWEHGLKLLRILRAAATDNVAPFMGAWIETTQTVIIGRLLSVAPFCGFLNYNHSEKVDTIILLLKKY